MPHSYCARLPADLAASKRLSKSQAATISVMGTDETLEDPQSALSFLCGMVYSRDKSTYAGTARSDDGGYTPALGNGDSGEEPLWFSCEGGRRRGVAGVHRSGRGLDERRDCLVGDVRRRSHDEVDDAGAGQGQVMDSRDD